ncbi:MAG: IS21 family transposase, partial [Salinisphaera sp.]|nr:IS21 family transposase [Salinisphaera sp.]
EVVEVQASERLVQLYFGNNTIATHPRSHHVGGASTEAGHMPKRHSEHQKWTPKRLQNWARDIGPDTKVWVTARLDTRDHPEQAYRVCLGLLNLSREYPCERLNASCRIANREGLGHLKHIKAILKSNRDKLPEQIALAIALPQDHDNIRGPKTFH